MGREGDGVLFFSSFDCFVLTFVVGENGEGGWRGRWRGRWGGGRGRWGGGRGGEWRYERGRAGMCERGGVKRMGGKKGVMGFRTGIFDLSDIA